MNFCLESFSDGNASSSPPSPNFLMTDQLFLEARINLSILKRLSERVSLFLQELITAGYFPSTGLLGQTDFARRTFGYRIMVNCQHPLHFWKIKYYFYLSIGIPYWGKTQWDLVLPSPSDDIVAQRNLVLQSFLIFQIILNFWWPRNF